MTHRLELDLWNNGIAPAVGPPSLSPAENTLLSTLRELPKCELHIHVEGSIHPDVVKKLAGKYGVGIEPRYHDAGYTSFFDAWFATVNLLREENDFEIVAVAFASRLKRAGVRWCEAYISPPDLEMANSNPLPFKTSLKWWLNAFERCNDDAVSVRLIVDLVRLYPVEKAQGWLDQLLRVREKAQTDLIVGIGLGGPESSNSLVSYSQLVRRARREGLLCVAHAGEQGSGRDVDGAVFELEADRLGHALGLVNSRDAYKQVLRQGIPIESCPTSSLRLSCVDSFELHPVNSWLLDEAVVTINTDDPALIKTELCLEYLHLHRAFGWGENEFRQVLLNAVGASVMPEEKKRELREVLLNCEGSG